MDFVWRNVLILFPKWNTSSRVRHRHPRVRDWRQDILHRGHPRHEEQQAHCLPRRRLRPRRHDRPLRSPRVSSS